MDHLTHPPTSSPGSTSSPQSNDQLLLYGGSSFVIFLLFVILCSYRQFKKSRFKQKHQSSEIKKKSPVVERNVIKLTNAHKRRVSTIAEPETHIGGVGEARPKVKVKVETVSTRNSYRLGSPLSVLTNSLYEYGQNVNLASKRSNSSGSPRSLHSSGVFSEYLRKSMGSQRSLSSCGLGSLSASGYSAAEDSFSSTNSIKDRKRYASTVQMASKDPSDPTTNSRSPGGSATNYLDLALPPIPVVIKPVTRCPSSSILFKAVTRYPSSSILFGEASSTVKSKPWNPHNSPSIHLKLPRRYSLGNLRQKLSDVQSDWGDSPISDQKSQPWDPGPLPKRIHVTLARPNVIVPSTSPATPISEVNSDRCHTPVLTPSPAVTAITRKTPSYGTTFRRDRRNAGSDRMSSGDISGVPTKSNVYILPLGSISNESGFSSLNERPSMKVATVELSGFSSLNDKPSMKIVVEELKKEPDPSSDGTAEEELDHLSVPKAAVQLPVGLKIQIPARVIDPEDETETPHLKAHSSAAFSSFSYSISRSSTVVSDDDSVGSEQTSTSAAVDSPDDFVQK